MLLSPRKNGLTSLFKEVRVFKAIVIAESLARVVAAIRITSVRWWSYLPLKTQKLVLSDPAFVVPRFASRDWRSLVQDSFHVELRNGLAIGDLAHLRVRGWEKIKHQDLSKSSTTPPLPPYWP